MSLSGTEPVRHYIELVQTPSGYTRYTCYLCTPVEDTFTLSATNGEPLTVYSFTPETPADALDQIFDHLTANLDPQDVPANLRADAAMLTALTNNIEPGVDLLAENLPNAWIDKYDQRNDEI